MAIAHVQTPAVVVGDGTASTYQRAFASDLTSGNTVVVCLTIAGSVVINGVADSLSNTYTQVATGFTHGGILNQIWYAPVTTSGACTVTITCGANAECTFTASEFSGVASTSVVDVSGGANGAASPATVSLVTTNANDVLIGAVSHASTSVSMTSGSGFTILAESEADAHMPFHSEFKVVSSTGTLAVDVTLGAAANWKEFAAALKASTGTQTTKTQTGKGRITATTSQVQTGKGRITATTTRTQTGVGRMTTPNTTRNQTGKSRIAGTQTKNITGKATVGGGSAVYPHIQSTPAIDALSSLTRTCVFPGSVVSGHFIVVTVIHSLSPNASTVSAVADTLGNSYQPAGTGRIWGSTGQYKNEIWYAMNVNGGACTVTVTMAATSDITAMASEFVDVALTNAFDTFGGGFQTSGTSSSFTLNTVNTDDLIVATMSQSGGGTSLSSGSGYTMLGEIESPSGMPLHSEYRVVATSGDYLVDVTLGASRNSAIYGASFKRLGFAQQTRTQGGVARVLNTSSQTQSGKATIDTHTSRVQGGVTRIKATTSKTQGGVANVTLAGGYPHVQTAPVGVFDASSSSNRTFAANVSAGNMIVACVSNGSGTGAAAVTSITDTRGNTYQSVGAALVFGPTLHLGLEIWYAMNTTGGPLTATITMNKACDFTVTLSEFANMAAASALDVAGSATGTGTTATRTITTANAQDVLIGACAHASATLTLTSGAGFTTLAESEEANLDMPIHSEFQAVGTSGAKTIDVALGSSADWAMYAAAFKRLGTQQTSKMQTGLARIAKSVPQTQAGKAAIVSRVSRDQTGRSFITGGVLQSSKLQPGRAAIVNAINYIIVDGVMQPVGIVTQSPTLAGLARITIRTSRTQTGVATIATVGTTFKNQPGAARVKATSSGGITGISRIERLVSQVQSGLARVLQRRSANQFGISRVGVAAVSKTQNGTARVLVALTQSRTASGKASIIIPVAVPPRTSATATVFATTKDIVRVPF